MILENRICRQPLVRGDRAQVTCRALGPLRAQKQALPVWPHSEDPCDDDIREEGSMKSSCNKVTADVSSAPIPSAARHGGHILERGRHDAVQAVPSLWSSQTQHILPPQSPPTGPPQCCLWGKRRGKGIEMGPSLMINAFTVQVSSARRPAHTCLSAGHRKSAS